MLCKFDNAGTLELSRLCGQAGQWLAWLEQSLHDCRLTKEEHDTLLIWLDHAQVSDIFADLGTSSCSFSQTRGTLAEQSLQYHVNGSQISGAEFSSYFMS